MRLPLPAAGVRAEAHVRLAGPTKVQEDRQPMCNTISILPIGGGRYRYLLRNSSRTHPPSQPQLGQDSMKYTMIVLMVLSLCPSTAWSQEEVVAGRTYELRLDVPIREVTIEG